MKNRTNITYTFLLLAIGIVSTILSNPILAQTEGNSQNQTGGQGQQQGGQGQQQGGGPAADSGGQSKAGDDIGSIEELQSLTTGEAPPPTTSNDTTPFMESLGKETSTDQGFAGDKEQQGGQGQQQGNQTGQGQQQGNQTGQGQQQGNQTGQGQQQGGQQEGNQTAGTSGGQQQGGQQEGNQTAGTSGGQQQGGQEQQQEGNQTGNPLTDIGEQIGNLFK
jgi:Ca-activated chloride channel family protein